MSLTYVKASCHCGLNIFQIPFVTAKLPLSSDLCHCNSCRHITGNLAVQAATMDGVPLSADAGPDSCKPGDLSLLKKYNASPEVTRYFCPTCSAYMFYETKDTPNSHWSVSTGALERIEGVVKVGYHAFIADTVDGGISDHYRVLEGHEIPRYSAQEGSETLPCGWKAENLIKKHIKVSGDEAKLPFYCHCKSISFYVTRGKEEDAKDPKKFWVVDGTSPPRFIAGHCVCTGCRLVNGAVISSWVILPRENVIDARTSLPISLALPQNPEDVGKRPLGLKHYESSPKNHREFCENCGACVAYWTKDSSKTFLGEEQFIGDEPTVIDLAAGLIDENCDGARAERWCAWYEKVTFGNLAVDKPGLEALNNGIKATNDAHAVI